MPGRIKDGLTRAEVDAAESRDFALGPGPLRPRDAATLILIDKRKGEHFVLMGRRHRRHAFMPGRFVFPGGRTDPSDSRVAVATNLHPAEEAKLVGHGACVTATRARAIALSAIRETYEEAGLLLGRRMPFASRSPHWQGFVEHRIGPALDGLRFVARAITPPGRVRRFDTRFFAAWRSEVAVELDQGGPTDELEEISWIPIREAMEFEIPAITRTVLGELEERLSADGALSPGHPVPFYSMRQGRFQRAVL
ncbi:NUDIX hydrolase [Chelativorans sp. Marseille-P2723]|uniref:NUDIX hydrolase n=1 Tax=Chelativorans sp. Marseille-P2723 TaxID=2709133 RepID=UPI00156F3EEA|nr:NUDIX hydrolase [Chelativorans sp. Marseille-P2723]